MLLKTLSLYVLACCDHCVGSKEGADETEGMDDGAAERLGMDEG